MKYTETGRMVDGFFAARPNRFIALVRLTPKGEAIRAHVPNTGRMEELLTEGAPVLLAYEPAPSRKTDYTLKAVCYNGLWVCVHATLANALAFDYMAGQRGVSDLRREVTYKNSRFDLGYYDNDRGCPALCEVKSVNLVEEGTALFPDAPTARGSKHLVELMAAHVQDHYHGGVIFVVQREDCDAFAPNEKQDPAFAAHLREARQQGIAVRALRCRLTLQDISIDCEIPVCL